MKKIVIVLALLALSFGNFNCGGEGSGSLDTPKGENPGVVSVVQLMPSHYIAQTNTDITLHAKILDGNGVAISDKPVIFTNLSPVGVLSNTSATTNGNGIATVTLKSTSVGFSTIQAEVNTGVAIVRDQKTVFFSFYSTSQLAPYLDLDVSGSGDPYRLFENQNDNTVTVTATVYNAAFYISGSQVTFGSDRPYKLGSDPDAPCSDGSDSCDVIFPGGNIGITNAYGQASVPVMVIPATLVSISSTLNIYAVADNGAYNIVTLFLQPVTISSVSVSANPNTVDSGGTSSITAYVKTTAGTPVPDGTTVNFSTNIGGIDAFSQTTNGVAEATFTAPSIEAGGLNQIANISAQVGGKIATVQVTVIAPEPEPVEPPEDTTSPTVTSTNPANGSTLDISDAGGDPVSVTITFSENIDCSTVTPATISITPVVGDWTLTNCSGANVVFRGTLGPAPLPGKLYSVNAGTGVKDLAGNPAVAYIFSFTAVD